MPADLPARIRAARRERGLTQADLAAILGVSRVQIGEIERGNRSPGESLRILAEIWIRDPDAVTAR